MAEQFLLKSTFHGSMGSLTGQKWKNKEVIHAKIWSKTPARPVQKDSLRAFEALNRVASAIAKHWWPWLGLKAVGMHKHNAVARFLAACVQNHVFGLGGFTKRFKSDGTAQINSWNYDKENGLLTFEAEAHLPQFTTRQQSWLVLVFDTQGRVFLCEVPTAQLIRRSLYIPAENEQEPFIITLTSTKDNKKYRLGGLSVNSYVINGILYTSFLKNSTWRFIPPNIISTDSPNVSVDEAGNIVIINE